MKFTMVVLCVVLPACVNVYSHCDGCVPRVTCLLLTCTNLTGRLSPVLMALLGMLLCVAWYATHSCAQ